MKKVILEPIFKAIFGILLIVSLTSCGGGGDSGGGAPLDGDGSSNPPRTIPENAPSAPTTLGLDPGNGQITVSWNAVSTATSYNLYMASTSGVTKTNYNALQDGTKHSAVTAPFTQTGLINGKTYFFVLTAVNERGESPESAEVSIALGAQGAKWNPSHTLGSGSQPDVSGDGNGNAMAAWINFDGLLYHIYAQKFSVANGWGPTETIADLAINEIPTGLKVTMYGQGNAFVAWHQNGGQTFGVFAKRFLTAIGWEPAVRIGFGGSDPVTSGYRGSPQVAVNADGKAVAVWEQPGSGVLDSIMASYYTPGIGWSSVVTIETGSGHAEEPVVSIDLAGNAISIWKQTDGNAFSIWANRFTAGLGWGTATVIEAGVSPTFSPALAMDGSGNALAVWLQPSTLLANRFEPGTGWKGTTLVSAGFAAPPDIAMNADGKAVVVWGDGDHILASRYSSGTGWSPPTRVDVGLDPITGTPNPKITIDSAGTAITIWQNRTSRFTGNYSTLTSGWQTPTVLSPTGCCPFAEVLFRISSASTGNAVAVWREGNTTSTSFARHFAIVTNP